MMNRCESSIRTDEFHGWSCDITGGACMFFIPDAKACAEKYGEGPLAGEQNDNKPLFDEQVCRICGCTWDHACPGGCYWVEDDLCSVCAEKVGEGNHGNNFIKKVAGAGEYKYKGE